MKKTILWLAGFLALVVILPGCAGLGKAPLFEEGVYPVHAKTFTYLELVAAQPAITPNIANLTETKPDSLTVDFDPAALRGPVFGYFRFGNNEQKTWFVIGKDGDGNWSDFYIDRNLDYHLSPAEKVTGWETGQGAYRGYQTTSTYITAPLALLVSYKGAERDYTAKPGFLIEILDVMKNNARDTFVKAYAAGFFEGEIPIRTGKAIRTFHFQLIDADSNGCFNDYGRDLAYLDANGDGYFRNDESHPLAEYFGSANLQRQIAVPPYPAKIAVTGVNADIDAAALEPGDNLAESGRQHSTAMKAAVRLSTAVPARNGEASARGVGGK